jgi:hypothetical protein
MKKVDDPIQVNVSFAELPENLSIRTCEMKAKFTDAEKQQDLLQDFWDALNYPVLGYLSKNRLWYLGPDSAIDKIIQDFSEKLEEDIHASDFEYTTVRLENSHHRRVVGNLLNKRLAQKFAAKGFLINHRQKTAFSGPLLETPTEPPLAHNHKFFESFKYRALLLEDLGISFQMDPVIRIFIQKTVMEHNEPVLAACYNTNCEIYSECINSLPRSVVKYRGDESSRFSKCPQFDKFSRVYNPWTGNEEIVPKMSLRAHPSDRSLSIKARGFALKSPQERWMWFNKFFNMISDGDSLRLDLGNSHISFNSPFTELPIVDTKLEPYKGYAMAGEIKLRFGPNMENGDPFQGLKEFGAFSFNKKDPRRPASDIRVFAIFPKRQQYAIEELLEKIKSGRLNYKGFHPNIPPFGVSLDYFGFSIPFDDASSYIKKVKARIENIVNDYLLGHGDVVLFVIPKKSQMFYEQLKDFTTVRKISNQMLEEHNVSNLMSSPYLLFAFALSLYTKAGMTPWEVDDSYFDSSDCYIGLAFSRLDHEGNQKFFLGVADVFNSFGEHLSFALHEGPVNPNISGLHVDQEFMTTLVEQSILRYIDKMEETPSIIYIHKPGKFLKGEIHGVSDALHTHESNRALLIHVQHNSLFRAYNPSLDYQPVATTYFRIGPGNAIVFPTGYLASKDKDHWMGTPKPVQLNMRWVNDEGQISFEISDDTLHFVIQNFLAFTHLRWSSLSSTVRDPLTIHAARVVADWQKNGVHGLEGLDIRDIL